MNDKNLSRQPSRITNQEFQEMDDLIQQLHALDLSDRSRIQQPLRQRLLRATEQKQHGTRKMNETISRRKTVYTFAGLALAILLISFALPPVQAFARQILAEIGVFTVTDRQIDLDKNQPSDPSEPTAIAPEGSWHDAKTAAEAAKLAGFPVYMAGFIPAGYDQVNVMVNPTSGGTNVSTYYASPDGLKKLAVSQAKFKPGAPVQELAVGKAKVAKLSVRGSEALWADSVQMGYMSSVNADTLILQMKVLMWEEEGFNFLIAGTDLTKEEAIQIAESLKQ